MDKEEKIFLGLIIFQIIMMMVAIKFLTGAARPPKQFTERSCKMADTMYILGNDMHRIMISANEINLMERLVMAEAGGESVRCQEAVAQVILNRWLCEDKFPNTITEVINEDGQFCTPAAYTTVSCRLAVYDAVTWYNTEHMHYPKNMYYFRADHYHEFGIPHTNIDHTYFSLSDQATD